MLQYVLNVNLETIDILETAESDDDCIETSIESNECEYKLGYPIRHFQTTKYISEFATPKFLNFKNSNVLNGVHINCRIARKL